MKKTLLLSAAFAATFTLGYAFNKLVTANSAAAAHAKRATSIGGIFFKCKDPAKMREWYKTHLGFNINTYGTVFEWRQAEDSSKKGFTQWSPFKESTGYFAPSTKDFMINYRVENLDDLVGTLRTEAVTVCDTVEHYDYGKFVHIMDPEGNKIELWEPNDVEYEKLGKSMGAETTK